MIPEYLGKDGFVWFHGVVEDIKDPLLLGRCRVRVFGYHSPDKQDILTEELPWAHPIQPLTDAAISGIGNSPTGLLRGSHVIGFFRDGAEAQQPVIFGSIGGIPLEGANTQEGFNDPTGKYPIHTEEPDTNRLARGEKEGTIVIQKENIVQKEIPIAEVPTGLGDVPSNEEPYTNHWKEPDVPYNAKYPYNQVYETESGHVQEFDDTPESERIHTWHTSGTFTEIHPTGQKVEKIMGDNYQLVVGDEYVHITGNVNVILGATGPDEPKKSNINILVRGNADIQVDENCKAYVGGNVFTNIHGNMTANVTGMFGVHAQEDLSLYSEKNINIRAKQDITLQSGSSFDEDGVESVSGGQIDLNPKDATSSGGAGEGGIEEGVAGAAMSTPQGQAAGAAAGAAGY